MLAKGDVDMRFLTIICAAVFLVTALPAAAVPPPQAPMPDWPAVELKASQGDSEAQVSLGDKAATSDKTAALTWYEKADAQGNAEAHTRLLGLQINQSLFVALKAAAETGDLKARYDYNDALRWQINGWGEAYSVETVRDLAQAGYAKAQADLGRYYIGLFGLPAYSWIPPEDRVDTLPKAVVWLEKAVAQDEDSAMLPLATAYALDSPLRDPERMEYWLQKVAYRPLPDHTNTALGDSDPEKLVRYRTLVALDALCPYYLGAPFSGTLAYQTNSIPSLKSPPDYAKARTCYRRRMTFHQADESDYILAELLEHGMGGERDLTEAAALYQAMAEDPTRDDAIKPAAMAHLGLIHAELGETQAADVWFQLMTRFKPYGIQELPLEAPYVLPQEVYDESDLMTRAISTAPGVSAGLTTAQRQANSEDVQSWLAAHPYGPPPPPIP